LVAVHLSPSPNENVISVHDLEGSIYTIQNRYLGQGHITLTCILPNIAIGDNV